MFISRPGDKSAQKQVIRIFHVAQMHDYPGLGDLHNNDIAHSQYLVAKTILANPETIVVEEGCAEKYDRISEEKTKEIAKIFPAGVSALRTTSFELFTEDQKTMLRTEGAAKVLLGLGTKLTVNQDEKKGDVTLEHYQQWQNNTRVVESCLGGDSGLSEEARRMFTLWLLSQDTNIFRDRENRAIDYAIKAAKQSGKTNPVVLLIYGANHQVEERIQERGDSGVVYGGIILTTQGGGWTPTNPIQPGTTILTSPVSSSEEIIQEEKIQSVVLPFEKAAQPEKPLTSPVLSSQKTTLPKTPISNKTEKPMAWWQLILFIPAAFIAYTILALGGALSGDPTKNPISKWANKLTFFGPDESLKKDKEESKQRLLDQKRT